MKAKIGSRLIASLKPQPKLYEINDIDLPGFLMRVHPSGVKTFYASYRLRDGRRNRCSIGKLGALTPIQARDRAKDILADVTKGTDPQASKRKARAQNFGRFVDELYLPWAQIELKTGDQNVKRLKSCFGHLLDKPIGEISKWTVDKWRLTERKNNKCATTINRDVAVLKGVLSRAVEERVIDLHPLRGLKDLEVDRTGRVRYLEPEEESRLRDELSKRDEKLRECRIRGNKWRTDRGQKEWPEHGYYAHFLTPMVLVSLNTGLRRGEMFQLDWENVRIDAKMPHLVVDWQTAKSSQSRTVPLNIEAIRVLRRWAARPDGSREGLVFPNREGAQLTDLKKSWAAVLTDAKVHKFRWHDLRHSFASQLVMKGVDLNTIRELLGHADLKMTLRYAHLAPNVKAEAVDRLVGG